MPILPLMCVVGVGPPRSSQQNTRVFCACFAGIIIYSFEGSSRVPSCRMECGNMSLIYRPEISRDYPLNLSILISGGKENNNDSPSNGE